MSHRTPIDWDLLQPALRRLGLATLAGVLLAGMARYAMSTAQAEHDRQQQRLEESKTTYRQAENAQELVTRYAGRFLTLQRAGAIGPDRRLDWVEALVTHSGRVGLKSLRYELTPQVRFVSAFPQDLPAPVLTTGLNLELTLVHERDLLAFITSLRRESHGLLWVDACDLERGRGSGEGSTLGAVCHLRWLTVPDALEQGGKR